MFTKYRKKIYNRLIKSIYSRIKLLEYKNIEVIKEKWLESFQSIGFGVRLNGEKWFFSNPKKIVIGNNVHIGNNAFFKSEGGLVIGDNTHISRNVTIYTVNHDYTGNALPYDDKSIYKPVTIGKNVWIGMNVSIIPGISVGEGAIIGMGTVVRRNVNPFEIVGSAKIDSIKDRMKDHYIRLDTQNAYGGINGKVLTNDELNSFLPSYKINRNNEIIFILSTGRSGSKSIVKILNQHPNIKAFHEDIRQIIRISTQFAHDKDNKDKYLREIETIFQTKIWQASNNQLLIHSDQRLWNLIPFLAEYFPNSKFIHLLREPIPAIKSMIARGWYQHNEYPDYENHDWAKYRIQGDLTGSINKEIWNSMNSTQKCTWYWAYVNNSIQRDLQSIPKQRVRTIRLENLITELFALSSFFNIKKYQFTLEVINKRYKKHDSIFNSIDSKEIDIIINSELNKYPRVIGGDIQ